MTKDPDSSKFSIATPLLPSEVHFEGTLLARISMLKMEYLDLTDQDKFPHLATNQYMTHMYYEDKWVTKLEPVKWVCGVQLAGLLHMLFIPHFHHSNINKACVHQLLTLVHDGCLWLGEPITITNMLIHRITKIPYKGADPAKEFVGKSLEKQLADRTKTEYGVVKGKCKYSIHSIIDKALYFLHRSLQERQSEVSCG